MLDPEVKIPAAIVIGLEIAGPQRSRVLVDGARSGSPSSQGRRGPTASHVPMNPAGDTFRVGGNTGVSLVPPFGRSRVVRSQCGKIWGRHYDTRTASSTCPQFSRGRRTCREMLAHHPAPNFASPRQPYERCQPRLLLPQRFAVGAGGLVYAGRRTNGSRR